MSNNNNQFDLNELNKVNIHSLEQVNGFISSDRLNCIIVDLNHWFNEQINELYNYIETTIDRPEGLSYDFMQSASTNWSKQSCGDYTYHKYIEEYTVDDVESFLEVHIPKEADQVIIDKVQENDQDYQVLNTVVTEINENSEDEFYKELTAEFDNTKISIVMCFSMMKMKMLID